MLIVSIKKKYEEERGEKKQKDQSPKQGRTIRTAEEKILEKKEKGTVNLLKIRKQIKNKFITILCSQTMLAYWRRFNRNMKINSKIFENPLLKVLKL